MVSNSFNNPTPIASEPDYLILRAISPDKEIYNSHIADLNDHFEAMLQEFDESFSETFDLGTYFHRYHKYTFATQLANHLADQSIKDGPEPYRTINTRKEYRNGDVAINVYGSTTFDGTKPNADAARSIGRT